MATTPATTMRAAVRESSRAGPVKKCGRSLTTRATFVCRRDPATW